MPDDAYAAVAGLAARPEAGLVAPTDLGDSAQTGRTKRLGDGDPDRVELVVTRHLLGQRSATVILENDEVSDQSEETGRREDALKHNLELGNV